MDKFGEMNKSLFLKSWANVAVLEEIALSKLSITLDIDWTCQTLQGL